MSGCKIINLAAFVCECGEKSVIAVMIFLTNRPNEAQQL